MQRFRIAPIALLLAACAADPVSAPAPLAVAAQASADLSPLGPLSPAPPPARPGAGYTLALRVVQPPDERLEAPVRRAAARWARVLGAGLTPYRVNLTAGACAAGTPAVHEVVSDLLVLVRFAELDGEGGVLGTAGPCVLRPDDAEEIPDVGLPIVGVVTLDVDDATWLADDGRLARLEDVAAHEIGHVLGLGTLWGRERDGVPLLPGLGVAGADLLYTGRGAVRASAALGLTASGAPVPVELEDALLRGRHWRRSVYDGEVMTGWLGDAPNAVSALSVGALADLGYDVRLTEAEPLRRAASGGGTTATPDERPALRLVDRATAPRFVPRGDARDRAARAPE